MELALRSHQQDAIEKLREGFAQRHRCQLLYAPTGYGKTEVAIALMAAVRDKYKRAAIVLDRLVLVDQTSMRLSKYRLPHGVFQAQHWKWDPAERLQVCSAQTLERRDKFPEVDLLIVDECHVSRRQTIEFIQNHPDIKVVGLTATPFTKGLGAIYTNVVCGSTTQWLVDNRWLCPLKVFIAKQIDMTGAKKVAGEWSANEVEARGIVLTGDIVQEWVRKTHDIFGKPEKTIVFCAGVAHGADLVEQFARAGYNFVSISYRDNDEVKRAAIEDFSKPDTQIHGLIATDILTRGFDVPDVKIGVSARPFSKSLSSHVQQMGRVMRAHPSKDFAVWLDHSGNYLRFRDDWDEVYAQGVDELGKTLEKAKPEPSEREKKESKCPSCEHLWPSGADSCPVCGYVRKSRSTIEAVPGKMEELVSASNGGPLDRQQFYSELLWVAEQRRYNPNWVAHKFREKFGVWPRSMNMVSKVASTATQKWIKSRNIAWAKSRGRGNFSSTLA